METGEEIGDEDGLDGFHPEIVPELEAKRRTGNIAPTLASGTKRGADAARDTSIESQDTHFAAKFRAVVQRGEPIAASWRPIASTSTPLAVDGGANAAMGTVVSNPDVFLAAVGHVAKARGMNAIAQSTGLGRESLYKALAPGAKPRYDTVLKVIHSLGVKLTVTT